MPITTQPGTTLAFQQQFRPIGRIRTGMQVEYTTMAGKRGKRPTRLETIRLTSADHRMLERAASIYGGKVEEWPEAPDGDALQLVTEARELDVLVPGGQPLSQWYEMWRAGGCLRRCTGAEETLSGGPCLCPADPGDRTELAAKGEACKPITRVNLLLPDMDVGAWLLVSHSFYAAVELPPVVSLLSNMATQIGKPVPSKLWIDHRKIKRPNQPPKDFSVPALRTSVTWAGLLAAGEGTERPALGPGGNGKVAAALPVGDTRLPDDPDEDHDDRDEVEEGIFTEAPAPTVAKDTAPASLTVDAFRGLRERHDVTLEETLAAGRDMFPAGTGLKDLDDADRGRLWVAISERRATVAST